MKDEESGDASYEIRVTSYVCTCLPVSVFTCLPGYNSMNAFANKPNIHDLHVAQVRFGGDVFLEPGSKRAAQEIAEEGEHQRKRNQPDAPKGGTRSTQGHPGKRRGKKRGGDQIGPASLVDGESAFACVESRVRFVRAGDHVVGGNVAEQKKSRRVGMSRHGLVFIFAREQMKRGMFERVVSSSFENEGKVEDHAMIIHRRIYGSR